MNNKEMEIKAREHDVTDVTPEAVAQAARESYQMIEEGVVEGFGKLVDKCAGAMLNEDGTMKTGKLGDAVVDGYKKIEEGVVSGYKKIETGAVEGFGKMMDKCVEVLFAKEGESVEDAKARLTGKDKE